MSLIQKGQTSGCSTIPLHPLCTASTGLTFLHQRQCPHHHIPLFHCIHCILHPLCTASTASTGLTILHQRQCPHHHIPIFRCIHWFDLFVSKTMSLLPYTTIPLRSTAYCVHCILCPLHTASTPSSHLCVILTQPDIYIESLNNLDVFVST